MKRLKNILLLFGFIIGLGILLYPTVSDWLARYNQIQSIQTYNNYVTGMSSSEMEEEWQRAREYNELVQLGPVTDPFSDVNQVEPFTEYDTILDIEGIMGYLEIPSIDVRIPIYHGVSDEVLQKGVGHIKSTALPIGGEGTHAVLSAHSGLPEAKLFTNLEQVGNEDYFYLYILDEILAYQVDQISVVEPDDISMLTPEAGKDYVTLVTCTPIGVNSHRLLVRGVRSEIPEEEYNVTKEVPLKWILIIIVLILIIIIICVYRRKAVKGKYENKKND